MIYPKSNSTETSTNQLSVKRRKESSRKSWIYSSSHCFKPNKEKRGTSSSLPIHKTPSSTYHPIPTSRGKSWSTRRKWPKRSTLSPQKRTPTNKTSNNKSKSTSKLESGFRISSSSSTPWLRKVQSHSFWRWSMTSPKWWERQIYFRIKSSSYQLGLTKSATSKDQRCSLNW